MNNLGRVGLILSCLAYVGHVWRVQTKDARTPAETLAVLLQAFDLPPAFSNASPRMNSAAGYGIRASSRRGSAVMSGQLKTKQEPTSAWPHGVSAYRFVSEDDPTFKPYVVNKATGYTCASPQAFFPLRLEGKYEGTFRVQFTLPGKEDQPKTIELMRTNKDNPSFGAVRVKGPIGADVGFDPLKRRLVVKDVKAGGNAKVARITTGDIIRGISVPENAAVTGGPAPYSGLFGIVGGGGSIKGAEGGFLMLDGRLQPDFEAAIEANVKVNGKYGEIVFLIERPTKVRSGGNDWWDNEKGEKKELDFVDRLKDLFDPQPK